MIRVLSLLLILSAAATVSITADEQIATTDLLTSGMQETTAFDDQVVTDRFEKMTADELFTFLNDSFNNDKFEAIISPAYLFLEKFSDDPRVWEVKRFQVHSLFQFKDRESEYLDFVAESLKDAPPYFEEDFKYNKAVWLEGRGRLAESRVILEDLLFNFQTVTPAVWASYLYIFTKENEWEAMEAVALQMREQEDMGEGMIGVSDFYLGLAYEKRGEDQLAIEKFDKVIENEFVGLVHMPDTLLSAMMWKAWLSNEHGDKETGLQVYNEIASTDFPDKENKKRVLASLKAQRLSLFPEERNLPKK